jgi:hypothetical protein
MTTIVAHRRGGRHRLPARSPLAPSWLTAARRAAVVRLGQRLALSAMTTGLPVAVILVAIGAL